MRYSARFLVFFALFLRLTGWACVAQAQQYDINASTSSSTTTSSEAPHSSHETYYPASPIPYYANGVYALGIVTINPHDVVPSTHATMASHQTIGASVGDCRCDACQKSKPLPPGAVAPEQAGPGAPPPLVEAPSDDFALDFTEQSGSLAATSYAAAPPMIGDNFGGGSQTIVSVETMPFNVMAEGHYLSGTPGDLNASIRFDSAPFNGSSDFLSSGMAQDTNGRVYAITEPVPPSDGPRPTQTGFSYASGTATNSNMVLLDNQLWDLSYSYTKSTTITIPNPASGGGGVVGRLKIAENASPVPRDRVFFNYSMFDNVPLRAGGVNVNRFTPGFEKYSPHVGASLEARFPFAATLSNELLSDGPTEAGNLEFGNIFLTYKKILEQGESWLMSGGVSVTVPTAGDLNLSMVDGTRLVSVQNKTVHVMPFVGGIASFGERAFVHGIMQIDVDTNGNPVLIRDAVTGNLVPAGRVQDSTFMYIDVGVGYWCRRRGERPDALLDAIIPTFELHFNRSLQPADVITSGSFQVGVPQHDRQILNMVVGSTFEFHRQNAVTVGFAFPIGHSTDQNFDGELRAFWNRGF